ncbi:hypothetical protein BGZ73_004283 [Actinomortierella ambigua]|nr:hypothetical protein BGZ73_004283 [Actinomortierella ambigua]
MKTSSLSECAELLQWIARHLDHQDVATCTLVSKLWNAQFSAVLWHTLKLPFDVSLLLGDPSLRTALQKHGRHVQSLIVLGPQLPALEGIEFLYRHCQQLRELTMNIPQDDDDWVKTSTFLRHSPRLDSLTLAISTKALADPTKFINALMGTPHMTSLSLPGHAGTSSVLVQLLDQCKHLRRLVLGTVAESTRAIEKPLQALPSKDCLDLTTPTTATATTTTTTAAPYALEDLSIQSCPWPLVEHLINHSPSLQRIKLPSMDPSHLQSLQRALRKARLWCSASSSTSAASLHTLHLQHLTQWRDEDLARLLKACPPNTLRHLSLCGTSAGEKTCLTVVRYQSAQLETLDLRNTRTAELTSMPLHELLTNCRRLTVFAAGNTCGTVALRAKDIVTTPWSCLHLRVLRVPIIGICRDAECRNHELCHLIQRQIYQQLGRLTYLEDLDLRNELDGRDGTDGDSGTNRMGDESHAFVERDQEQQRQQQQQHQDDAENGEEEEDGRSKSPSAWQLEPESLEWTLERGMDQLAGLAQLRSFDLRGTDHMLSEEEIVWMKGHWPRLRRFLGLANHSRTADVQEFTREFWPEIQLE